ncbi:uncharacterized protein LOC124159687 [Ischnura elegans]|uniref:uncharacterized protein LOC124159687 n=1 Tax=Ischnura elegans TaxID=197161 RepID=UPI001ED8AD23|nr:uncharacterized protein LOC124159687 [Ischnura elegans]
MTISHVNVESLRAHWSDFSVIFSRGNHDIIAVSETHLHPTHSDNTYSLNNFCTHRNDRTYKKGGGVAIFTKAGLETKVIRRSCASEVDRVEFMFLEVDPRGANMLVGVVYCPPKTTNPQQVLHLFSQYLSSYSQGVILGDFNVPINRDECVPRAFLRAAGDCGLSVLSRRPTFHSRTSHNTLDLILVADPGRVLNFRQSPVPGLSGHDMVSCTVPGRVAQVPKRTIITRSLSTVDPVAILDDPSWARLENIDMTCDPSESADLLSDVILEVIDRHAPARKICHKQRPAPWLTPSIRGLMSRRDKIYSIYTKNKTPDNWEAYRVARNKVKQELRNAKGRHFKTEAGSGPKAFWRTIRAQGGVHSGPRIDLVIPPDQLLDGFVGSAPTGTQAIPALPPSGFPPFHFSPVNEREVDKAVCGLKTGSPGPDGICSRILKLVRPAIVKALTRIINASLSRGSYPAPWKKAWIIPLPKVSTPQTYRDYRPISVGNCLGKILDGVVLAQLSDHVFRHDLLCHTQSAFRPNHSTQLAIVGVLDSIREAMDGRRLSVLTTLDVARAYDTVNHGTLLHVLRHLNIGQHEVDWVADYLRDRLATIRVRDGPNPDWRLVTSGVPQGSCLSPLLFSLFVDGLGRLHTRSRIMLYADDVLLLSDTDGPSLNECVRSVNEDLECVCEWLQGMGLSVNASKSNAIIVGNKRLTEKYVGPDPPALICNGTPIKYVSCLKYLGIFISSDLSWDKQISTTVTRVHWGIRRLKGMQFKPRKATRLVLVKSLLFPILDYSLIPCSDHTGSDMTRLQVAQNACLRYALRPGYMEHLSPHYARENILRMVERRTLLTLMAGYKVWTTRSPRYVFLGMTLMRGLHDIGTRNAPFLFQMPLQKSSRMAGSFIATFVRNFNNLPLDIRLSFTRSKVYKHILAGQKSRL